MLNIDTIKSFNRAQLLKRKYALNKSLQVIQSWAKQRVLVPWGSILDSKSMQCRNAWISSIRPL
jgi:hypothetical protein